MAQILLGASAFVLIFAFDWVSWLGVAHLKPLLGLAAVLSFGGAVVWTLASAGRFDWPAWTSLLGWPLLLIASALLIYSLLIEIPFAATYAMPGTGDRLIKVGTYALVRHPGVLWFALWMAAWLLISRVRLVLWAGIVWLLLDIVLVWLEEVLLFRRMFAGYEAYQRETPMLIPTWRSVARCLRTLPLRTRADAP
jgi:protein-S-isoprenylcysteine O-methyltransferase Ste14